MNLLRALWSDQRGAVVSAELVLVTTIVVIGLIVGLSSYRTALIQELGDSGSSVGALDQSYAFTTVLPDQPFGFGEIDGPGPGAGQPWVTVSFSVADSSFSDLSDDCDVGGEGQTSAAVVEPTACILVGADGGGESAPALPSSP